MSSLPFLFKEGEETFKIKDWLLDLCKSPTAYQKCVVKTMTHVKNLHSKVFHEYLQVIIEDTETGNRTRVLAERQQDQDQVIVGRWGSSKKNSSFPVSKFSQLSSSSSSSGGGGGDLPLPLYTLTFKDNNCSVIDLALFLAITSEKGGTYKFFTRNCYWFAITAYTSLKLQFKCQEKAWPFAGLRRTFFRAWRNKKAGEPNAEIFETERKIYWEMSFKHPVTAREFLEEVYSDAIAAQAYSSDDAKEMIEEHAASLIEKDLDKNITIECLEQTEIPPELSIDTVALSNAIRSDNQIPHYVEVFHKYKKQREIEQGVRDPEGTARVLVPDGYEVVQPAENDLKKMDYVIMALVGQTLEDYKNRML